MEQSRACCLVLGANDVSCCESWGLNFLFSLLQDLSLFTKTMSREQLFEIGTRVTVYWPGNDDWYKGTVVQLMDDDPRVLVEYDNGNSGWLDPEMDNWRRSHCPKTFIMKEAYKDKLQAGQISKLKEGTRLSVWVPLEKEYYTGTLTQTLDSTSDNQNPHLIEYDDRDKEWTNLVHRNFRRVYQKAARLYVGSPVSIYDTKDGIYYPADVIEIKPEQARPGITPKSHREPSVGPLCGRESCEADVGECLATDCYRPYELGSIDDGPNVHKGAIQERSCE